jgi:hypothetical protein
MIDQARADPDVVALLESRGAIGPFASARRTAGGYSYSVERADVVAWIDLHSPRYRADPMDGVGWLVAMDGNRPGLIGHGRWRSLSTAVRAVERALSGCRVRIPTGRRSGLCPRH